VRHRPERVEGQRAVLQVRVAAVDEADQPVVEQEPALALEAVPVRADEQVVPQQPARGADQVVDQVARSTNSSRTDGADARTRRRSGSMSTVIE
jgi:hypothetical protein